MVHVIRRRLYALSKTKPESLLYSMSLHVIAYVLESFHFLALVNVTEAEKIDEDYYNGMEGSSSSLSICSHV